MTSSRFMTSHVTILHSSCQTDQGSNLEQSEAPSAPLGCLAQLQNFVRRLGACRELFHDINYILGSGLNKSRTFKAPVESHVLCMLLLSSALSGFISFGWLCLLVFHFLAAGWGGFGCWAR